jgi:hypothetical protein
VNQDETHRNHDQGAGKERLEMIPKKRTLEEEEEMERLMDIAAEREPTHEEQKAYYLLLGYDETWAEFIARNGFPIE